MSDIILADNNAILTQAMESNLAAFWMGYGQSPTGDAYTDSHLMRFSSIMPHPLFNGVYGGHFSTLDTAEYTQAVDETSIYFQSRQRPAMWWVGPTAQSPILTDALKRNDWHHIGDAPGMVLSLDTLDDRMTSIDGLTIERVQDLASLHQWVNVLGPANDITATLLDPLYKLESTRGFPNDVYVRYLARFNSQPVAASAVYYNAGVAGIFAVATVEKARGRGFGSAVTIAPLIDAKQRGYKFSVLQASELGYPVYQRLGYEHRWMINLFAHQ